MIHFISLIHFSAIIMYETENRDQLKDKLYVITLLVVAACIDQQVGIITWQPAEPAQPGEFLHYIFTVISINKLLWDLPPTKNSYVPVTFPA